MIRAGSQRTSRRQIPHHCSSGCKRSRGEAFGDWQQGACPLPFPSWGPGINFRDLGGRRGARANRSLCCPGGPTPAEVVEDVYMTLPQWVVGPWSACSSNCGAATATRSVTCSAGSVAQCQIGYGLDVAGDSFRLLDEELKDRRAQGGCWPSGAMPRCAHQLLARLARFSSRHSPVLKSYAAWAAWSRCPSRLPHRVVASKCGSVDSGSH